ncbi:MAG TPA: hypothetical protein V6D12_17070, partial [Candidatus Obscuribacterales bacterium]
MIKFSTLLLSTLLLSPSWSYGGSNKILPFNTSKLSLLAIATQTYTPVRGTRVSLIKPEGFTPAKNYSGFEQNNTGAGIMITEMPAPYSQIAPGLNAANLKTRGMALLKKESITI